MIFVPLAVPAPLASRQSPDCTPVIVPLALTFHCWFVCPLQSQMITWVPLVVPRPEASRHLLPYTCRALPDVYVKRWLVWPLQSHSCTCVPLVVLEFGTSRQRPDCTPTTCDPVPVGGGLVVGFDDWTPAAAITDCAPDGQLALATVTLPDTTLPRSPLVTFVLPLVLQLLVTVKLPITSPGA